MTLNLEDKKAIVAEVAEVAAKAVSAVAADYRGLTVANMTALRASARKNGVYLRVVRNTFSKRALQDTEFACLKDALSGPLFLAFSYEDPGAAARIIRDAAKNLENLKVRALAVGGNLLGPEKLEALGKFANSRISAINAYVCYAGSCYKIGPYASRTVCEISAGGSCSAR